MKRLATLAAACVLLLLLAASASASQTFNIVHPVTPSWLSDSMQAIQHQSGQIANEWGTPSIVWDDLGYCSSQCGGSWTVYIGPGTWLQQLGFTPPSSEGAHGYHLAGAVAVVQTDTGAGAISNQVTLDHEVAETVVDPNLGRYIGSTLVEICDPVERYTYVSGDGAWLSDWVFPAYYSAGIGPYDYMQVLK